MKKTKDEDGSHAVFAVLSIVVVVLAVGLGVYAFTHRDNPPSVGGFLNIDNPKGE